jgi:hypothetical protein
VTTCDEILAKRLADTPTEVGVPDYSIPSKFRHATYKVEALALPYGEMQEERHHAPVEKSHIVSSEVVSAECIWAGKLERDLSGTHTPLLDIDMPAALIPSSTEGHYHLYIDKEMTWREYKRFLKAMMKAGIIEKGYYKVSVKRKATQLRLPWIKKVEAPAVEPVLRSGY